MKEIFNPRLKNTNDFNPDKRIETNGDIYIDESYNPDRRITTLKGSLSYIDRSKGIDAKNKKESIEKNKVDNVGNSKYNDNAGSKTERIKSRNENLEGQKHPETGVPFEKRQVEVDGKQYEVVAPKFESVYDAQLPEDKLKSTDREQFKECNAQLKEAVENDPELREKFDEEQLEQIENGDTPDGYTWHHDIDVGKMQLVDTETHQKTGHTGGRSVWGGGSDNR